MKDYQKVILYVYPRIGKFVRDIDGMVAAQAFTYSGSGAKSAEKIAEMICVKRCLMNLQAELERMVQGLSVEERYLLEYKFFRRKRVLEGEFAGYALDCNERTYFRKQERLAAKLNAEFIRRGMSEAWFLKTFENVGFMRNALENIGRRGDVALTGKRTVKGLVCANKRARSSARRKAG